MGPPTYCFGVYGLLGPLRLRYESLVRKPWHCGTGDSHPMGVNVWRAWDGDCQIGADCAAQEIFGRQTP
jgi:hypothetical protein